MDDRKLVSVVTGTWQRHDLVLDCIKNIRKQTYRPLEMVIVSDGPDPELRMLIEELEPDATVPITFQELGRWWSGFFQASLSAAPFLVAQLLASGDYQVWCADDERMAPEHIESLVTLLEETDSDFVYSLAELYFRETPHQKFVIGTDPPQCGSVTNVLYRVECLDYAMFDLHVGSGTDWHQVYHWMQAGARYSMSRRTTISHRVDKRGEGPLYRPDRQPLRGHGG